MKHSMYVIIGAAVIIIGLACYAAYSVHYAAPKHKDGSETEVANALKKFAQASECVENFTAQRMMDYYQELHEAEEEWNNQMKAGNPDDYAYLIENRIRQSQAIVNSFMQMRLAFEDFREKAAQFVAALHGYRPSSYIHYLNAHADITWGYLYALKDYGDADDIKALCSAHGILLCPLPEETHEEDEEWLDMKRRKRADRLDTYVNLLAKTLDDVIQQQIVEQKKEENLFTREQKVQELERTFYAFTQMLSSFYGLRDALSNTAVSFYSGSYRNTAAFAMETDITHWYFSYLKEVIKTILPGSVQTAFEQECNAYVPQAYEGAC